MRPPSKACCLGSRRVEAGIWPRRSDAYTSGTSDNEEGVACEATRDLARPSYRIARPAVSDAERGQDTETLSPDFVDFIIVLNEHGVDCVLVGGALWCDA